MTNTVKYLSYSNNNSRIYTKMIKGSILTDINTMPFKSEKQRENEYDKQILLFNNVDNVIKNDVDDVISKKEIDVYNEEEKNKKIWKIIGLVAVGVGITVGAFLLKKHFSSFIKSKQIEKETIDALKIYQTDEGAYIINSRLRNKACLTDKEIAEADRLIENINKGMRTNRISKPIRVYRGESFSFIQSQNKELGLRLKKAFCNNDTSEIQKILEEFKKQPLIQRSFMSTSLDPTQSFGGNIQWIFDVKKGKNAIYMAPELGFKSGEKELLLSENSVISIKKIQIIMGKYLKIFASVS